MPSRHLDVYSVAVLASVCTHELNSTHSAIPNAGNNSECIMVPHKFVPTPEHLLTYICTEETAYISVCTQQMAEMGETQLAPSSTGQIPT